MSEYLINFKIKSRKRICCFFLQKTRSLMNWQLVPTAQKKESKFLQMKRLKFTVRNEVDSTKIVLAKEPNPAASSLQLHFNFVSTKNYNGNSISAATIFNCIHRSCSQTATIEIICLALMCILHCSKECVILCAKASPINKFQ